MTPPTPMLLCPFCNVKDQYSPALERLGSHQRVGCTHCGIWVSRKTEAEAIAAWNTRPQSQGSDEAVKALEKIIKSSTYLSAVGNTNCRFCDNDMDHQGTYENMHEADCEILTATKALAQLKGLNHG